MTMTLTIRGAAFLAAGMLAMGSAQAALLAEEAFDYPTGDLTGRTPGLSKGFSTTGWALLDGVATNLNVVAGSLSSDQTGIYTSGNRVTMRRYEGGRPDRAYLEFDTSATGNFAQMGLLNSSGNIGRPGTTLFFSYMFYTQEVKDYLGLEAYRDGSRVWFMGQSGNSATMGIWTGAPAFQTVGKNHRSLFVLKIEFGESVDTITGWLTPTAGEPAPTPHFADVEAVDMSFDGIALFNNAHGTHWLSFDEIRVGTTYEAVTSDAFVPVKVVPRATVLLLR